MTFESTYSFFARFFFVTVRLCFPSSSREYSSCGRYCHETQRLVRSFFLPLDVIVCWYIHSSGYEILCLAFGSSETEQSR